MSKGPSERTCLPVVGLKPRRLASLFLGGGENRWRTRDRSSGFYLAPAPRSTIPLGR
jgi:hypothetical protein